MVASSFIAAPPGSSLKSLVDGFVLTKETEGKSVRTVEFYRENLKRFLWFAHQNNWPDDIRVINEWHIKQFIGYVVSGLNRWGTESAGSASSVNKASQATVRHYYVTLMCFFNWVVSEGFLPINPALKMKVAKSKPRVIIPYTHDEIQRMLDACKFDIEHGAKFLGSRNRALVLVMLDTGLRLAELVNVRISEVDHQEGHIKIMGKGSKERVVRMGKTARKALWHYSMFRGANDEEALWLSEERRPLTTSGVQSIIQRLKERCHVGGSGSIHRFRHTFAVNFLRADRNVFNLQYLLGHSDLDMVRHYTQTLGMEDALKAHEKSSPADLFGFK